MKIHPKTKKPHFQPAFTLIELLVVTAIIAILAALLLPFLNSMQKTRDKTQCLAHLKNLGVPFLSYANDNDGRLPLGPNDPSNPTQYWRRAILPYVQLAAADNAIFQTPFFTCPVVSKLIVKNGGSNGINSYAMSQYLSQVSLLTINHPSQKILAMEAYVSTGYPVPTEIVNAINYFPTTYHVGGNSILFVDGHVEFWSTNSPLTNGSYAPGGAQDMWSPNR